MHLSLNAWVAVLLAAPLFLSACAPSAPPSATADATFEQELAAYERAANDLLTIIDRSEPPVIAEAAHALNARALPLLDSFAARHPACRAYLAAAVRVLEELSSLSVADIEARYHHDGALPAADNKCYHAKDLLVHPATVLVLLREHGPSPTARGQMSDEIAEVLAHLGAVRHALR